MESTPLPKKETYLVNYRPLQCGYYEILHTVKMHEMLSFQDLTYRCEYGERVHEGGRKGPDPDSDVVSGVALLHVGDNICIGK